MSTIKNWFNILTNNEIHAYNRVTSRDLSICYNFLQIPDTDTIVMTVSVMKNKVKKNSLSPMSFARIMSCVEESLSDTQHEYINSGNTYDDSEDLYFMSVKNKLADQWYIHLCCHRVFFIPEGALWSTIKNLFKQQNIQEMKSNDVSEVSVFINTEDYDCNAKFY